MALSNGSSGSAVSDLQRALKEAGFDPGPIDGIYGPQTESAVRAYQLANDMEGTGVADASTLAGLGLNAEEEDGEGGSNNLPGEPEIWRVGNHDMVVYTVPDSFPPIYLMWRVPDQDDLQSFFGPGVDIVYDQEMSYAEMRQLGGLIFGTTDELANFDEDPFSSWAYQMETEAATQPWIMDEDYQALIAMAVLEGRALTEAEIQSTDWWNSHTSAQREWMKLYHGDPEEAQRRIEDNRIIAEQRLRASGLTDFSAELVNYMADQVTQGNWSVEYYDNQIIAISDPESGYNIDEGLRDLTENVGSTIQYEDNVRELVNTWLGPAYGAWDDSEVQRWAGILRNDPNGEQRLIENLKNQRVALFPWNEDRNTSYDDMAQPWRTFGQNVWGQQMDETEEYFQEMVRNNDVTLNGALLRKKGLQKGVGKVINDTNTALIDSFGGSVRQQVR